MKHLASLLTCSALAVDLLSASNVSDTMCTGSSASLDPHDCEAWLEFTAATNYSGWVNKCPDMFDPCGCCADAYYGVCCSTSGSGTKQIGGMYLQGNGLAGTIPESFRDFFGATFVSLSNNRLEGNLPNLNFAQYTSYCVLNSADCVEPNCNKFSCPLPPGADLCKYHSGHTQHPWAPTSCVPVPTPKFKCNKGQCIAADSGISKEDCSEMCSPFYQCANGQCILASVGVPVAECQAGCSPDNASLVSAE
jgi:hypothetical protein